MSLGMKPARKASLFRKGRTLVLTLLVISCGSDPTGLDVLPRTIEAGEFTVVVHGGVSDAEIEPLLASLNENKGRIQEHLRVDEMPHIRLGIWPQNQQGEWYDAMQASVGAVYQGATGYLVGSSEMRLRLNPHSATEAVHEYAHLVSIQVNPTIPNNPRWLWEAIATFEARQLYHPSTWAVADRVFPGFQALNQYNSPLPYRWGYLISSAVIDRWGDDGYLHLIEANGQFGPALGVTEAEFREYIQNYVEAYL